MINREDWESALGNLFLGPLGTKSHERYWVIRREAAGRGWRGISPAGTDGTKWLCFTSLAKAEEAARAAADHPGCLEVRILRVGQDVVLRIVADGAPSETPEDGL